MTVVSQLREKGITLNIYVQPGAKENSFAGNYLERLKLKVRAKATDGKANEAVCEFIAHHFGVSKTCVQIVRGLQSREKTVHVVGDPMALEQKVRVLLS